MAKIKYAFLDLDPVAYIGAMVAEKSSYQWRKLAPYHDRSEVFASAADAKVWMETEVEFGGSDIGDWERVMIPVILPKSEALKIMHGDLKQWIKDIIRVTDNPGIILRGFLTPGGRKSKDIDGLQDRYQFNRYLKKHPEWTKAPNATHLDACREELINCYDWVEMSPPRMEADALVIGLAERKGLEAIVAFKDKDLKQVMTCNYIDMNDMHGHRVLRTSTELGSLVLKVGGTASKTKTIDGDGFLLIAAQTICGDTSDGYKGVARFGPVKVVDLLGGCTSVDAVCLKLCEFYQEKFPDGIKYKDWAGKPQERTWEELLIQHMWLAYHERSSEEEYNPIERYFMGVDPIWRQSLESRRQQ